MAGIVQQNQRLIASCYVAVGGGVATLVASAGGIASVTRNGAGDYTVTLKGPVSFGGVHDPLLKVSPVGVAFAVVTATLASATTVSVYSFNQAGAAADTSFTVELTASQRAGGA